MNVFIPRLLESLAAFVTPLCQYNITIMEDRRVRAIPFHESASFGLFQLLKGIQNSQLLISPSK